MKKVFRNITLAAIIIILCFALGGCEYLDEARAQRFYLDSEGNLCNQTTKYIPLSNRGDLNPLFEEIKSVYLVNKDVPILLVSIFGESMTISDDNKFIIRDNTDRYESSGADIFSDKIYCRSDCYTDIANTIKKGFTVDNYGYYWYNNANYERELYKISDDQLKVLQEVLNTVKGEPIPDEATINSDYSVNIGAYSADRLFSKPFCTIHKSGVNYTIQKTVNDMDYIYAVPGEYNYVFSKICEKQMDSGPIEDTEEQ